MRGIRKAIEKRYIQKGDLVLDISGHGISNCLELMQRLSASCTFHYPQQITSSIDGERLLAQAQSFGLKIAKLTGNKAKPKITFLAFDSHQLGDTVSQANFLKGHNLPSAQKLKAQGIRRVSITLEHPHGGLEYVQPKPLSKEFIEEASQDEG